MEKIKQKIDLQVSELANEAVQEKLTTEFTKVFTNIHDLNTTATDKRTVNVKFEFKPDEKRQVVTLTTSFATKLADVEAVGTTVLTGKDISDGTIEAKELKSNTPGQTYMDLENGEVKTDVGDPIDVIEKEEERQNLLDFRKKAGK